MILIPGITAHRLNKLAVKRKNNRAIKLKAKPDMTLSVRQ